MKRKKAAEQPEIPVSAEIHGCHEGLTTTTGDTRKIGKFDRIQEGRSKGGRKGGGKNAVVCPSMAQRWQQIRAGSPEKKFDDIDREIADIFGVSKRTVRRARRESLATD